MMLKRTIFFMGLIGASSFASNAMAQSKRAANVFVETVETKVFSTRIEALGNLAPNEEVELTLNDSGRVQSVHFEDGQRIRAHKKLVTLVQSEQKALVEAEEARVSEAQIQMDRVNRLILKRAVSQSEVDEAQRDLDSAKADLRAVQSRQKDRVLFAPFDGVVGFREVSVGAYVQAGDVVASLVDDSRMKLEFSIPSTFLRHVKKGMTIEAMTDDYPGQTFEGVVSSINNAIDPLTRSVSVRAIIPNPEKNLLQGMFMEVNLNAAERDMIAVKEEATQSVGPRKFVYVVEAYEEGFIANKTEVELGVYQDGYVEVLSGLEPGTEIVTEGLLHVRDGGAVKIQSPSILISNTSYSSSGAGFDSLISRD